MTTVPVPRDRDPAPVHGRPDLTCPLTWRTVRRILSVAMAHPWRGGQGILARGHTADTVAILTPDRPTRVALTWDEADGCLHLSVSHPRLPAAAAVIPMPPDGVDLPSTAELDAWARVFFGHRHHLTHLELTRVAHVRLCFAADGHPIPGAAWA